MEVVLTRSTSREERIPVHVRKVIELGGNEYEDRDLHKLRKSDIYPN
jgi:hypothetical protein